jgi:hypothetical protein
VTLLVSSSEFTVVRIWETSKRGSEASNSVTDYRQGSSNFPAAFRYLESLRVFYVYFWASTSEIIYRENGDYFEIGSI